MKILGLHHITLISANAQRTVDFYTGVLGLRLIKQTVNFDDPSAYHIYFGDAIGTPGSAITFFEWSGLPKGKTGIGGTHHFALTVADDESLLKWKRRLTDLGVSVEGPYDRKYFRSIYFNDPDGVILEIATAGPGWTVDESIDNLGTSFQRVPDAHTLTGRDKDEIREETWGEPVSTITDSMALMFGMHHITVIGSNIEQTDQYYRELLGMRRLKMTENFDHPGSAHWYWGVDEGKPGTLVTYFERQASSSNYAQMGTGMTHHFALAVADEEEQSQWQEHLTQAGYRVSPIMDRDYFRSIYTRDPDGHIVELATLGPGFSVDEDATELGRTLQLPKWLEQHRAQIESRLKPLIVPEWNPDKA